MLVYSDIIIVNNKLYAVGESIDGIFELNLKEEKLNKLNSYKNVYDSIRFKRCLSYGVKIIFIPYSAGYILLYDTSNQEFKEINLPIYNKKKTEKMESEKFLSAVIRNGYLFLFPWRYPAIVKMNLETYEIVFIDNWKDEFSNYITNKNLTFFREDILIDGEYANMITWNSPIVLRFNMDTLTYEILKFDGFKYGFSTICKVDETVYLTDSKGYFYKTSVSFKNNEIDEQINFFDGTIYRKSYLYENKLIMLPTKTNKIMLIDLEKGDTHKIQLGDVEDIEKRVLYAKQIDNKNIIIQINSGEMYVFNIESLEVLNINILDKDIYSEIKNDIIDNISHIVLEEKKKYALELSDFFDIVIQQSNKKEVIESCIGEEIYKKVIKTL